MSKADEIWARYTAAMERGDRVDALRALQEWDAYCAARGKGRPRKQHD